MPDNRPIGVFDSGVGGLTVLQAIQHAVPGESTIYLGDLARCPYGPRLQAEVKEFAVQIGDILAEQGVKLLVVACNTATAAAIDMLRLRYPFPVVGVVEPGASAAVAATRNGRIGVIATDGTVASGAYRDSIEALLPDAHVYQRSASWLVPLIERGPLAHGRVAAELRPTLDELREEGVDTLILGCTHFPLVRSIFEAGVGDEVMILDSAETTALRVTGLLQRLDLFSTSLPWHRFLVTGPAEAFAERAQAMFRASPPIETIDLTPVAL